MSQLPTLGHNGKMLAPNAPESIYTDTNSETESISEEDRVRRLFTVCDTDGDGFIDRFELTVIMKFLKFAHQFPISDCLATIWLQLYTILVWMVLSILVN